MRKIIGFIRKIFLFLLFFSFCYIFLLIIWGEVIPNLYSKNLSYQKFADGHAHARTEEIKIKSDIDLLFLGSSRSYRHYDTRYFQEKGFKVFNLGTSSQTMVQTEYLVRKYIKKIKPEVIVLDIWPGMFTSDGVESTLDLLSNGHIDFEAVKLGLSHRNLKVINTIIFSYYDNLTSKKRTEDWRKEETKDTYISGGFVEKDLIYAKEESFSESKKIKLNHQQVAAFHRIIKIIKESNIDLKIVQSPMHKGLRNRYNNFSIIENLIKQHNEILFDYSNSLQLDESLDFYDPYHLNQNGVEKYNKFFLDKHF